MAAIIFLTCFSAMLINAPGMFIIITLSSLVGIVMYAYYSECDPLKQGVIYDPNQVGHR